jgi:hypothetical protein
VPSLRRERLPEGERLGGKKVAVSPAFGLPPSAYWHPDTPPEVRAAFEAMRQESVRGTAPAERT